MHEDYKEIFDLIKLVINNCNETYPIIYEMNKGKKERYINFLICEAFKNIECIMNCLDINGLTSSCVLMRQLIEQTAYIKVLTLYKDICLDEYIKFYKVKQEYVECFGNISNNVLKLLNEYEVEEVENTDVAVFLEQGWLRILSEKTDNKISDLMKLANLGNLIAWRRYFNNFVHLALSSSRYIEEGQIILKNNVSYILCVLFDQVIVSYNKLTRYDYQYEGKSFRHKYKLLWNEIKEKRCESGKSR